MREKKGSSPSQDIRKLYRQQTVQTWSEKEKKRKKAHI